MKKIPLLFLCLQISCFKVGPDYTPPENTIQNEWHELESNPFTEESPPTAWWKSFEDPLLEKYIEAAALCNKELLRAEAAICEARALRQVAASNLFPQINADLSAIKTYFSKNGPVFAFSPGGGQGGGVPSSLTGLPFSLQTPQIQNLFNALFDASWEIDLFGKTRRTIELADAHIGTVIEQRNDLLISILAELARNYIDLRSSQLRAKLIEENIKLLEQSAFIIVEQFKIGTANKLDLEQIEAELAKTRSLLPPTYSQIYRSIYAISILTGELPEALVDELLPERPLPRLPEKVAIGLRSDLLRRRPDVREAERKLAEATAHVGIAVASFYPTFTLLGDAGLQSLEIKKLFQARSRTWAYGSDFNIPVFQGGRLIGNLKATQAECCMAAYDYQNCVLAALQDAEGALVSYTEDLATLKQIQENAKKTHEIVRISCRRYETGLVSLLILLQSKRQAIVADLNLVDSDTTALVDLISLYKALGGGWEPQEGEVQSAN